MKNAVTQPYRPSRPFADFEGNRNHSAYPGLVISGAIFVKIYDLETKTSNP